MHCYVDNFCLYILLFPITSLNLTHSACIFCREPIINNCPVCGEALQLSDKLNAMIHMTLCFDEGTGNQMTGGFLTDRQASYGLEFSPFYGFNQPLKIIYIFLACWGFKFLTFHQVDVQTKWMDSSINLWCWFEYWFKCFTYCGNFSFYHFCLCNDKQLIRRSIMKLSDFLCSLNSLTSENPGLGGASLKKKKKSPPSHLCGFFIPYNAQQMH